MMFFERVFGTDKKDLVDLSKIKPSYMPGYKLGGFHFYGTLDEGDPQYNLRPPSGVVRVQYKKDDRSGKGMEHAFADEKGRVGFFKCSRFEFKSFLRAWANWNGHTSWGDYDAEGTYPDIKTLVVPYGARKA